MRIRHPFTTTTTTAATRPPKEKDMPTHQQTLGTNDNEIDEAAINAGLLTVIVDADDRKAAVAAVVAQRRAHRAQRAAAEAAARKEAEADAEQRDLDRAESDRQVRIAVASAGARSAIESLLDAVDAVHTTAVEPRVVLAKIIADVRRERFATWNASWSAWESALGLSAFH